jgi:naphthalene 1,2-dioxygenase system ferredoxin subunit|tara:strand:+ start:270 stop:656 length:387 start_codon:yes stop_codon:yes gene_type:complete
MWRRFIFPISENKNLFKINQGERNMTDGNWQEVAKADDIKPDEPIKVTCGTEDIALFHVDGEIFATHDICTHAYASLSAGFQEGGEVECPLHEGRFNVKNGRALCAPVTEGLKIYEVKVDNGTVFVKI